MSWRGRLSSLAVVTVLGGTMRSHVLPQPAGRSSRMGRLPRVTLWAWERREDLRDLDPLTTAVASLARTVIVDGRGVRSVRQANALLLPASDRLRMMRVVRIEMRSGAAMTAGTAMETAAAVVGAVGGEGSPVLPPVSALQVDFDATRSQRAWYRGMLTELRARLPEGLPLSITALASWCAEDRWMAGLPVDEAVPMLFRMEPDRRRAGAPLSLREPLCQGSVGVSTREAWPAVMEGKRVYVFPDGGWKRDDVRETIGDLR